MELHLQERTFQIGIGTQMQNPRSAGKGRPAGPGLREKIEMLRGGIEGTRHAKGKHATRRRALVPSVEVGNAQLSFYSESAHGTGDMRLAGDSSVNPGIAAIEQRQDVADLTPFQSQIDRQKAVLVACALPCAGGFHRAETVGGTV